MQTMMLRQHALHHVQKMQLRHYCVPCASGFKADSRGIHIQFIIKYHRIRRHQTYLHSTLHYTCTMRQPISRYSMVSHGIRATFYSGRRRINSFLPVTGIGRSKEKKVLTTTMHTMCWQGFSVWYTSIISMAGRGEVGVGAAEKWQTTASEFAAGPPSPG